MRPSNMNPRYENTFSTPVWQNLSDPGSWGQGGGVFVNVDGTFWGHEGAWQHAAGMPGSMYADPYASPYDAPYPNEPQRYKVIGDNLFSTGTGALLVLGLVWLASEAANRKLR
jgi:hypothetical protein